jgi:hypothetical protein
MTRIGHVIPDCGDIDSSTARSALEHRAYTPLNHRTFSQWTSRWGGTQHESGSASFGIKLSFPLATEALPPRGPLHGRILRNFEQQLSQPLVTSVPADAWMPVCNDFDDGRRKIGVNDS